MSRPLSFSPAEPIRKAALPLTGGAERYDPLLDWLGDASLVLIGEATCGTHDFQRARAQITRRLIEERGFSAVVLDTDWRDTRRLNRYVRGQGRVTEAVSAMAGLQRFPAWRWRNAVMLDFAGWLRSHNEVLPPGEQTGFYGLDLFCSAGAMEITLDLLDGIAPVAAAQLRERAAYDSYGLSGVSNPADTLGLPGAADRDAPLMFSPSVAEELMGRLLRNHHAMTEEIARHGGENEDDFFFLVENARLSRGLASYYRRLLFDSMGAVEARNRHLATILDALLYAPGALPTRRSARRMVVWTHNALLGDTRALEEEGEMAALRVLPPSLGQLVRERHAGEAFLIGQTTALGTVTTASGWDRPVERRVLEAAPPGSVEALFHQAGLPQMMLNLQADDDATELLREAMVERSFGPVLPAGEQRIRARMADRFDAVLHFDESRAVEPLEG